MNMRSIAWLLLFATSGSAEVVFNDLVTNRTGSALSFSMRLHLRNSSQWAVPKVFMWTEATGVQLFREADSINISPGLVTGGWTSNHYSLAAPEVSADGCVLAFTATSQCNTGTPCVYDVEKFQSTILKCDGTVVTTFGGATLSPNGRYALLVSSRPATVSRLVDLETGLETSLHTTLSYPPNRRVVANDGTVLTSTAPLTLQRGGEVRQLSQYVNAGAMLDDEGTRVIASAGVNGPSPVPAVHLIGYDIATGSTRTLAESGAALIVAISQDASRVVYTVDGQAWLTTWDGSVARRITDLEDAITSYFPAQN
jgi:hypothetical protein